MQDLNMLLNRYLDNCRADGQSALSLKAYELHGRKYLSFCVGAGADPCKTAAVYAYKAQLARAGLKLGTIATYLIYIRGFFAYAVSAGAVASNPVTDAVFPPAKALRAERKPYAHLMGQEDIRALVACLRPARTRDKTALRNRAMVLMLIGCGLRNTELRQIKPQNLFFGEGGRCEVYSGKGGKYRLTTFPAFAQEAVRAYMAHGRPAGLTDEDLLFGVGDTAREWHEIERSNLSIMVERYVKSATGFDGAKTHALRHAYASLLLSDGVKVQEIQALLGHASIATTQRYAELLRPDAPVASANAVFAAL